MDATSLLITLFIGAASGWMAGFIRQGYGFGLLGNIVIGIIGSFIGSWLFARMGWHIGTGLVSHIATGVVGALILLFLIGLIRQPR